jgi:hypothetical protein
MLGPIERRGACRMGHGLCCRRRTLAAVAGETFERTAIADIMGRHHDE